MESSKLQQENVAGPNPKQKILRLLITLSLLVILFAIAFSIAYFSGIRKQMSTVVDFQSCTEIRGSIIQEGYPRVCRLPNGKSYTEIVMQNDADSATANGDKVINKNCIISGCNGEICQSETLEPMSSICSYREEFECYKNADCKFQEDTGECGWSVTDELISCLNKF